MQNSSNKLPKTYNHIAFKIDEQDIDSFVSKIQMLGLTVEPGRSRVKGEASLFMASDPPIERILIGLRIDLFNL